MANSIIATEGDGSTVQFVLNFTLGILKRSYVKCRVGTEVDGLGDPVYRSLEWVTDSLVNILGAVPGDGVPIIFTRTVPKDALLHDYSNGAAIEEINLDESNLQTIMSVHEFLDGRIEGGFLSDLNMNGYRLTNLGAGVDDTDAATVAQLNEITDLVDDAEAQADISTAQAVIATAQAGIATTQAEIATTKAVEAAASAASVNLPSIVAGSATKLIKVNAGGTAFELGAKLPNFVADKRGTILVQNANDDGFEALSQGTPGQVLTSAGADSLPAWANAGGMVLLSTQTASASADIQFTSGITSTYKKYIIDVINHIPATDATGLYMRMSLDGGSTYGGASDYSYNNITLIELGGVAASSDDVNSFIHLTGGSGVGNASGEGLCARIEIFNPAGTTMQKNVSFHTSLIDESSRLVTVIGSGRLKSNSAVNAIQLYSASGNITSGTFKLYGVL